MYKIVSRMAVVTLAVLAMVAGAGMAGLHAQAGSVSSANAKTWIGEWTLTLQGGRGPMERALTIKDAAGKVAATMGGGRGAPIEIADVSMRRLRDHDCGSSNETASSRKRTKSPGTMYGPRTSAVPTDAPLVFA